MTFFPYVPIADVFFAFRASHFPGKVIVLVLFAGSIFAWSIMLTKFMELRRARRNARRFLQAYRAESSPVGLYVKKRRLGGGPLAAVYDAACQTVGGLAQDAASPDWASGSGAAGGLRLGEREQKAVATLVRRVLSEQALRLESHMGTLATAVTAAPFLGLLGTVWGVMHSFGSMAQSGAATLSAVAPGVSGALLTTVVGLLVALPSSVGYNMLTNRIRGLAVEMENFSDEFLSDVERHFS